MIPLLQPSCKELLLDAEKFCSGCKQWLPVARFYSCKHNSSGLQTWCKDCQRIWRNGHPEIDQRRQKAHPEVNRGVGSRRRARKLGNGFAFYSRQAVYVRDRGLCWICGEPVDPERYVLDHFIPLSRGGPDIAGNVRVAHQSCNDRRGTKLPTHEEAQTWLAFLRTQGEV